MSPLMMLRLTTVFFSLICILKGSVSLADVFRYVDEDGVICLTDCPKKKGAVRIYRDRKSSPSKVTRHKSPSGMTGKTKHHISKGGVQIKGLPEGLKLPLEGRISSTVGLRHDPFDGLLRFHNGIDIAVREGTPVKPVAPGNVYFSGTRNGYGNMVIISHDDGMITIYAHNSMNLVKMGERVGSGTTIAFSGSTGRSTGPHLHFEAWKDGGNLSEAFLGRIPEGRTAVSEPHPRRETIRKSMMADGSILFTNLP